MRVVVDPGPLVGDPTEDALIENAITTLAVLAYPELSRAHREERERLGDAIRAVPWRGGRAPSAHRGHDYGGRDYEAKRLGQTISKAMRVIVQKRLLAAVVARKRMGIDGKLPAPSIAEAFRDLYADLYAGGPDAGCVQDDHKRVWQPSVPVLHLALGLYDALPKTVGGAIPHVIWVRPGVLFLHTFYEDRLDLFTRAIVEAGRYATLLPKTMREVTPDRLVVITFDEAAPGRRAAPSAAAR